MRAREWVLAATFGDPAEYGIPDPPAVRVCRLDCGGLALSAGEDDPFIAAERPVDVRR
jgi:hypothetical protein